MPGPVPSRRHRGVRGRSQPNLGRTDTVPGTARFVVSQEIWGKSANRIAWSPPRWLGTHNPLVAGSSPARPTSKDLVNGGMRLTGRTLMGVHVRGAYASGRAWSRLANRRNAPVAGVKPTAVTGVTALGRYFSIFRRPVSGWLTVEPMTGIEPAYSAWEADVLPLNYIGDVAWEG
jgi:hypothetical protein